MVFMGNIFFVAAVLLRESLFINSILLNSEAWFNLTDKEINVLTIVDNALVRSIWASFWNLG